MKTEDQFDLLRIVIRRFVIFCEEGKTIALLIF